VLGSSNFLVPNATFFVELIAFLIVVFVLGKWVLPPIAKAMDQRQGTIRQALADAEEAKRSASEAEAEYKRVIGDARSEARAVVEEANKVAETLRSERREQAEAEYQRIVGSARAEIDAQTRRASEELRQQAADLAIAVAERVIGEGIDEQTHRALIDRSIAEVESQTAISGSA
jgi:F-type H+-transporting ATPase subunit b